MSQPSDDCKLNLGRLLSPASIAIVGASEKNRSIAANTIGQLLDSNYAGTLYLVNPRYSSLFQIPCYPDLESLPVVPDLVVFAISGLALEAVFDRALQLGVGGVLIYAANFVADESEPSLPVRLRRKAAAAGVPVCGGNSMGFYNYDDNVFVSFDRPPGRPAGGIALIAHSGSAMTYLANNDARFCFNFVISSGQETSGTVADYIRFVLSRESTRAIALFLETVREPKGFIDALDIARARSVPVVIVKLGRTEQSAAQALTHSGAIVGDHDAFLAVCRRHGALVVRDLDEMIATALLFSLNCRPSTTKISSILDSGGMRELMLDLADDHGVEFAAINQSTRDRLATDLDAGLTADNPLDAMGALGRNSETTYLECGKALLDDPTTGLLTVEFEFRDDFSHYPELFRSLEALHAHGDKPVVAINSLGFTSVQRTAADLCHRGIACINGLDLAIRSMRNLIHYAHEMTPPTGIADRPEPLNQQPVDRWLNELRHPGPRSEATSLALLQDFNLPVVPHLQSNDLDAMVDFADHQGYPVVLKTATTGVLHKSDCGGVITGLENRDALCDAYRRLAARLGPEALIMPQVRGQVELAFGMQRDPQFGPMIVVAAGGILVELLDDRICALAPFGIAEALSLLDSLRIARILSGARGEAGVDRGELARLLSAFSSLVTDLSDVVAEIDINPIIVGSDGIHIVDALVVADPGNHAGY